MLSSAELKVVLSTLTQRRAYIIKSLEKNGMGEEAREAQLATLKHLDSCLKKFAKPTAMKGALERSPPAKSVPVKKAQRKQAIPIAEAYFLIAEDNPDSAYLLKSVLEDMGATKIDVENDGRAALRALEKCSPPYDVVLCDWDMPEMNGLEVRKASKPLAKLRDTHFMIVTAASETSLIKEAIINGVHDYIVKPIDIEVLEAKLKAALEGEPATKEEVIANKKA